MPTGVNPPTMTDTDTPSESPLSDYGGRTQDLAGDLVRAIKDNKRLENEAMKYKRKYEIEKKAKEEMAMDLGPGNTHAYRVIRDLHAGLGEDVMTKIASHIMFFKCKVWIVSKMLPKGWKEYVLANPKHVCARMMNRWIGKNPDFPMPARWVWFKWMIPAIETNIHHWRRMVVKKFRDQVDGNVNDMHF